MPEFYSMFLVSLRDGIIILRFDADFILVTEVSSHVINCSASSQQHGLLSTTLPPLNNIAFSQLHCLLTATLLLLSHTAYALNYTAYALNYTAYALNYTASSKPHCLCSQLHCLYALNY